MGSTLITGLAWLLLGQVAPGVAAESLAADQPLTPPSQGQPLDGPVHAGPALVGYGGVVPGAEGRNPLAQPKSDPPRLVWTGFKMAGDKSELFLQTTRPVNYDVSEWGAGGSAARGKGRGMSVFLRNCRIHLKNNGRRLDTRFFATPVEQVTARQRRRNVEIQVSLEESATPTARTEPGPDGTFFLVLSFPPGQAQKPPAAAAIDERVAQ